MIALGRGQLCNPTHTWGAATGEEGGQGVGTPAESCTDGCGCKWWCQRGCHPSGNTMDNIPGGCDGQTAAALTDSSQVALGGVRRCHIWVPPEDGVRSEAGIRSVVRDCVHGGDCVCSWVGSRAPSPARSPRTRREPDTTQGCFASLPGSVLLRLYAVMGAALPFPAAALHSSPSGARFLSHFMPILASPSPPAPVLKRTRRAAPQHYYLHQPNL